MIVDLEKSDWLLHGRVSMLESQGCMCQDGGMVLVQGKRILWSAPFEHIVELDMEQFAQLVRALRKVNLPVLRSHTVLLRSPVKHPVLTAEQRSGRRGLNLT